jgi:hypothetical protein
MEISWKFLRDSKNVVETYVWVLTRSKTEELQMTALNEIIKLPWGASFDANDFAEHHFGIPKKLRVLTKGDLLYMTDVPKLKQLVSLAISKIISGNYRLV